MTLQLSGHHLLSLHAYFIPRQKEEQLLFLEETYGSNFKQNFVDFAEQFRNNVLVHLVVGYDSFCEQCPLRLKKEEECLSNERITDDLYVPWLYNLTPGETYLSKDIMEIFRRKRNTLRYRDDPLNIWSGATI